MKAKQITSIAAVALMAASMGAFLLAAGAKGKRRLITVGSLLLL